MQKILIVEDEKKLARYLQLELTHEDYEIRLAHDGRAALTAFEEWPCDLILLDLMLPELSGIEVCRRIRQKSAVPIIMLTAKDDVSDKVMGLDMGADDYVSKPFGIMELISRIKAVLRRSDVKSSSSAGEYVSGKLRISWDKREVYVDNEAVALTLKEYELLKLFIENSGVVIEREKLLQKVWGIEAERENRTLDVHIRTLRSKLKDVGERIQTVRGVGYKYIGEDQ